MNNNQVLEAPINDKRNFRRQYNVLSAVITSKMLNDHIKKFNDMKQSLSAGDEIYTYIKVPATSYITDVIVNVKQAFDGGNVDKLNIKLVNVGAGVNNTDSDITNGNIYTAGGGQDLTSATSISAIHDWNKRLYVDNRSGNAAIRIGVKPSSTGTSPNIVNNTLEQGITAGEVEVVFCIAEPALSTQLQVE